jgi:hypothetical protein
LALDVVSGVGGDLTERLSVGAALILGSSYLDGPFVDLGGMVPAYALRGTVGANYRVGCDTTLGCYWQTRKRFTFDDAVVLRDDSVYDIHSATTASLASYWVGAGFTWRFGRGACEELPVSDKW